MTAWPLRVNRVARARSNMAISVASRMPNKVFSSVTVSPTRSARACVSSMGSSRTWWVIARASLELNAARRDDRLGAAGGMTLDIHGDGIHGDVGGGHFHMHPECRCTSAQALR